MGVAEPVMAGGKGTRMKSEEEKPLLRVTAKGQHAYGTSAYTHFFIYATKVCEKQVYGHAKVKAGNAR